MENLSEGRPKGKGRGWGGLAAWLRLTWVAAGLAAWALALGWARQPAAEAAKLLPGGAPGLAAPWPEGCLPVVASSRGKSFYLSWCEGAEGLASANLRRFCGVEAAFRAGYRPAKGCVALASGGRGSGVRKGVEKGRFYPLKTLRNGGPK